MQSVNVTVPSSTGSQMAGTIDFPATAPLAFAVFAHCFACSRQTLAAARTCKQLTQHGIATLRFDFPGLGQSEGDFAKTSFSQNVADIEAAANWLSTHYEAPQLLIGHSLGGAATLAAASRIASLRAVATIGAPFDPAHSVLHYADKIGEIDARGQVEVTLGGRQLSISKFFLEDLADTDPVVYLRKLKKPLLILHSPTDQTVGIDNAQNIFRMTRYPKSLVTLDKADHLLTKEGAAARVADLIGAWASEYLVPATPPTPVGADSAVAHPARGTKFGVVVRSHDRTITADHTRADGGRDQGITAEGLLLSAIAVASTQAIQAKAQELKIKLADARVEVTRTPTSTPTDTFSSTGTFTRTITLTPAEGTQLPADAHHALTAAAHSTALDELLSNISFAPNSGSNSTANPRH